MVFGGWGFGRWQQSLMNGIKCPWKRPQLSCLFYREGHSKEISHLWTWKWALSRHWIDGILILDSQTPELWQIRFIIYTPPSLLYFASSDQALNHGILKTPTYSSHSQYMFWYFLNRNQPIKMLMMNMKALVVWSPKLDKGITEMWAAEF